MLLLITNYCLFEIDGAPVDICIVVEYLWLAPVWINNSLVHTHSAKIDIVFINLFKMTFCVVLNTTRYNKSTINTDCIYNHVECIIHHFLLRYFYYVNPF